MQCGACSGRRSQQRREFLEHWDPKRIDDDLWLEVTIRHLYGTHLPAHVIRTALAHPHASQALLDLSDLWPFFRYDAQTRTVAWQHLTYRSARARGVLRYWPTIAYVLLACLGMGSAYMASGLSGLNQWMYSFLAMMLIAIALICLQHGDALKVVARVGDAWLRNINAASASQRSAENERSDAPAQ